MSSTDNKDIHVADVHSRIDRIEVTLTHAVEAIEKIAEIVNKPQATRWGPILTAISLLFLILGGYTTLITAPLNDRAERLENQVYVMQANELKLQRDLGRIEGRMELVIPNE